MSGFLTIFVAGERFDFIGFFALAGRNLLILLMAIFVIFCRAAGFGILQFSLFYQRVIFFLCGWHGSCLCIIAKMKIGAR